MVSRSSLLEVNVIHRMFLMRYSKLLGVLVRLAAVFDWRMGRIRRNARLYLTTSRHAQKLTVPSASDRGPTEPLAPNSPHYTTLNKVTSVP
jgi:hypothetical protein